MTALQPSFCAESATPCGWFPAEAAITPRLSCSGVSCAILLYAPRSLKENTGCMSSRLSKTVLPMRAERLGANFRGLLVGKVVEAAVGVGFKKPFMTDCPKNARAD